MNRKLRRGQKSQGGGGGDISSEYIELFREGVLLHNVGNYPEAQKIFNQILLLNPDHAHALHMLGLMHYQLKNYEEAEKLIRRAMIKEQNVPTFYNSLGDILRAMNRNDEALKAYEYSLEIKPGSANALEKLGHTHLAMGNYNEAVKCFKLVATVKPDMASNIALIYADVGRFDLAMQEYKNILEKNPKHFETLNNLAGICGDKYARYEEAIGYYNRALEIQPNRSEVLSNLASTYKNLGQLDKSIVYFKKAIEAKPEDPILYSNLLMAMIYASTVTPEDVMDVARKYGDRFAKPLLSRRPFKNVKNPDRKLKIGFVSPDFRNHPVHTFFEPIALNADREKFEIFAYSHTKVEDFVAQRLKAEVDHWRDIRFINDDDAAELIKSDMIDILVDLTGHTGGNRLLIFARKPAPIQITWLGFPATTGIKAIDYRLTDVFAEPPGMTEHLNIEELWRLPEIFCCYRSGDVDVAVIDHPPFEDNGYITFGCFNNFTKVTDPVMETWGRIMNTVPDCRLLLEIAGIDNPKTKEEAEERLGKYLPMDRVILQARKSNNQYVLYNKIDIALDPFPCVGGTTSFDTMWMGVPFVTLAGKHFGSRMGVTILTNAGLPELIAQNTNEYVKIASDLAKDRDRLKKMRHNLRDRVIASPLMDQKRFVRNMEDAFRGMWKKYLEDKSAK